MIKLKEEKEKPGGGNRLLPGDSGGRVNIYIGQRVRWDSDCDDAARQHED